jgi:hypothetical protein
MPEGSKSDQIDHEVVVPTRSGVNVQGLDIDRRLAILSSGRALPVDTDAIS